jgi:hypothetical protein
MTRVLVHAGFHKTGTTSLQTFLALNRAAYAPDVHLAIRDDLGLARHTGRLYGQRPGRVRLMLHRRALARFVARLPEVPLILISRETLAGAMPGYQRHDGTTVHVYAEAPALLSALKDALVARFGTGARIELAFTTRAPQAWGKSLYRHWLRTLPLTESPETFAARIGPLPGLDATARDLGQRLALPLHVWPLEDWGNAPLGVPEPLLDLIGRPPGLVPAPRRNPAGSADLARRFLELNRTMRPGAALRAAKDRMWRAEQGPAA